MTCVVGLHHEGVLYFGSDAISVVGSYGKTTNRDAKVFEKNGMLVGVSGAPSVRNVLQYTNMPVYEGGDPMVYLVNPFLDALRDRLREKGMFQSKEGEEAIDASILIGLEGELYFIGSTFGISRPSDAFYAIGIGEGCASGAFYATQQFGIEPQKRVLLALQAAARFSTDVSGPFFILSSVDKQIRVFEDESAL